MHISNVFIDICAIEWKTGRKLRGILPGVICIKQDMEKQESICNVYVCILCA